MEGYVLPHRECGKFEYAGHGLFRKWSGLMKCISYIRWDSRKFDDTFIKAVELMKGSIEVPLNSVRSFI